MKHNTLKSPKGSESVTQNKQPQEAIEVIYMLQEKERQGQASPRDVRHEGEAPPNAAHAQHEERRWPTVW